MENCKHWDVCSAPICPLDTKKNLQGYCWYADEEICRSREFSGLAWIRNQKKIAKRTKDNNKYFNFEMLNRNCRITKGIIGLDPEKDEIPQLKKWLRSHPIMKEMSESQKKIVVKRFKRAKELGGLK